MVQDRGGVLQLRSSRHSCEWQRFPKEVEGILTEIKGWAVVIRCGHIGLPHIQLLCKAFIGLLDIVLEHFQLVNPPVR